MFSKKSRRVQSSYKMYLDNNTNENRTTNVNNLSMNFSQNATRTVNNVNLLPTINHYSTSSNKYQQMSWGEPTWSFFHTLAEKVKEESFNIVKNDIMKYIFIICSNLPCPECAQHAKMYMSSINFNSIQTKTQLKEMLYVFHNGVNRRKGHSLLERADLDAKYSGNVLTTIFYNFLVKFQDKHASIHLISEDMYRKALSKNIVKWFNSDKTHFDE